MRHTILAILTFFICFSVFSQKKNNKFSTENPDVLLKANMQKNIEALYALHSHNVSTTALLLAADYKKIGLQTIVDSSNYLQFFNLDLGKEIKPATFLKINDVAIEPNNDYWPFAFCPNGFFAGTAVWDTMQNSGPYLYDLKPILEKNKNIAPIDLLKQIRELTSELTKKGLPALIVYNSSEINDNLTFSPNDTTSITTIPVIYFTPSGIKKLKNESAIANAIDAKIVLGEKIINGNNVFAYINNSAINTVVIAASNNNLFSTAATLELARLLKEICYPTKKNTIIFNNSNYIHNNYLFVNFDDVGLDKYGSDYFFEHLPFNKDKINYAINIGIKGAPTDTSNYLKIYGIKTSSSWNTILKKIGIDNISKNDISIPFNLNDTIFYKNNIPFIDLYNPVTEVQNEYKTASVNNNDVKTINYIIQLIGSANDVGKLPFNKQEE